MPDQWVACFTRGAGGRRDEAGRMGETGETAETVKRLKRPRRRQLGANQASSRAAVTTDSAVVMTTEEAARWT
jgi:transposase-like protein